MSAPTDQRVAQLEARIAELEQRRTIPMPRFGRRLVLAALALALVIPAATIAAPTFTDVPTSNKFYNDIEALVASGITSGCSANKYCPDGLVTRGQMAAFLNRLGALAPGKAPKVNADKVDGRHANELTRVARWSASGAVALPANPGQLTFGPDLAITAPAAGFVMVNLSFTVSSSDCTACFVYGRVAQVGTTASSLESGTYGSPQGSATINWVFPVDAGQNTFRLVLRRLGTTGTINATLGNGTALYVPFGPTGGSTLTGP